MCIKSFGSSPWTWFSSCLFSLAIPEEQLSIYHCVKSDGWFTVPKSLGLACDLGTQCPWIILLLNLLKIRIDSINHRKLLDQGASSLSQGVIPYLPVLALQHWGNLSRSSHFSLASFSPASVCAVLSRIIKCTSGLYLHFLTHSS